MERGRGAGVSKPMKVRRPRGFFWQMKALAVALTVLLAVTTVPIGAVAGATSPSNVRAMMARIDGAAAFHAVGASELGTDKESENQRQFAAMEARVQAVFDRLAEVIVAAHPQVAEYTIQPVIEKVPNAWINQNNEIYVTSGLLDLLQDDHQLAGVIGHEIAHGTQGHIPHRIHQSLWSAFAIIALGTLASTQGSSDWGGLLHMRDLFMYAFSREQESEADLVGMRFARRAGYRAEGLVEALKAMDDERRRLPQDSVWQDLYRTHPPMSQRVTDLRLVLATEQLHRAPLTGAGLTAGTGAIGAAAAGPEEAALGLGRALLIGDESAMRPYVLPGRAKDMLARRTGAFPPDGGEADWSEAELEVMRRTEATLATVVVVRLWRPATAAEMEAGLGWGRDDAEVPSPPLKLTLQQSARGWVVTAWEVDGVADRNEL